MSEDCLAPRLHGGSPFGLLVTCQVSHLRWQLGRHHCLQAVSEKRPLLGCTRCRLSRPALQLACLPELAMQAAMACCSGGGAQHAVHGRHLQLSA